MSRKLLVSLVFLCAFFFVQNEGHAASNLQITPKNGEVLIYDNRGGELTEIGRMVKGQPLLVHSDYGANWWQVKFANAYGYVKKSDVTAQAPSKGIVRNKQPNTNRAILVHRNAEIYDNSSGKLVQFAMVKEDYRYPILGEFGNFWKVDAGGRVGFIAKKNAVIDKGVRILMYHHILSPAEKNDSPFANTNTTIRTTEFNEQMEYLKKNGYSTISTADLEGYLNRRVNIPARTVVLTIDDGNISSRIYAYPKLKELGFKADQFIITSRTPSQPATFNHKTLNFLSKQEMEATKDVFNYHAHTHNLHNLTNKNQSYVVAKSRDFVKKDLMLNRSLLNNTTYIAYPFGQFNNDTFKIMRETGFTLAYTTKPGYATLGSDKLQIPRMGIEPNISLRQFANTVATGMPPKTVPLPKPEPEPIPPLKPGEFSDVPATDAKYNAIMSLSKRGIISGYPDRTFRPNADLTRGQAAKILANTLGFDSKDIVDPGFKDVKPTDNYYKEIAALVQAGIVSGYDDNTFRPGEKITRAHIAKMLTNGFSLDVESFTGTNFTDVKATDWYAQYVQTLVKNGITEGTSPTTYSPNTLVKRGQMALFVTRSESVAKKQEASRSSLQFTDESTDAIDEVETKEEEPVVEQSPDQEQQDLLTVDEMIQ